MLGKLIRYDFKMQAKPLAGLYAVSGLIAVISAIFRGINNHLGKVALFQILSQYSLLLCYVSAMAAVVGSCIYVVLYFRRNLLRDEGYLMHTLPVPALWLYASKLLTGTFFGWLSLLVAFFCVSLGSLRFHYPVLEMMAEGGISEPWLISWLFGITLLLGFPCVFCQFYTSLVIGYTWKVSSGSSVNRDLLSVVVFVVLYMIQQAFSVMALAAYLMVRYKSVLHTSYFEDRLQAMADNVLALDGGSGYMCGIFGLAVACCLVLGTVLFSVGVRRLSHHLNLE